jgi:hypothetical protein
MCQESRPGWCTARLGLCPHHAGAMARLAHGKQRQPGQYPLCRGESLHRLEHRGNSSCRSRKAPARQSRSELRPEPSGEGWQPKTPQREKTSRDGSRRASLTTSFTPYLFAAGFLGPHEYIKRQGEHQRKTTFEEEHRELLADGGKAGIGRISGLIGGRARKLTGHAAPQKTPSFA